MAKTSMIVKAQRKRNRVTNALANGSKPKKSTRAYNCCLKCGRTRGYFRFFGTCRICLREMFRKGEVPGVKKSSW
jgi:small subunit ribosomal protein S14